MTSEQDLLNIYSTGTTSGGVNPDGGAFYMFAKGTGFDDITFGDDDTLSWYSSFDLSTTNFWGYMNTYFVATGQFALTANTIRWEGGANGTDHPNIKINLEDGYVLNINNLWFAANYARGLWHRKDYSTWWIQNLSPGGLYQFQLYSYNSVTNQQCDVSFDVVGSTTQSYTFFMGTNASPVVTDIIEADAYGKIFINCMDDGVHGASLAWIRIRAVDSEPPFHIDFSAYVDHTIEYAQADLTSKFSSVFPKFLVGSAIPIIGGGGMNGTGGDQGIATESSYIGSDRTALDAFNNSVTHEDRWQATANYGQNEWIKFDVGNNRNYIEIYRIWARGGTNSSESLERAQQLPRDWRIEGSDDDVNWTILDTRTGINNDDIAHTNTGGGISSEPFKEYRMQNPGTYRYYRLWVLSTNSIHGLTISELAYYGRSQANSSNSYFEQQKTGYPADAGGINFWHYAGDNTPATFKCIADTDGTCTIVYGCLSGWQSNDSVKVYVNGSLDSETTLTSATTTISVSMGDVIEIQEMQAVMGLYSITFVRGSSFSGTPPSTISFTAGGWGTSGHSYIRSTYANNSVRYDLKFNTGSLGSGHALVFSINNNQLILDVNDATYGYYDPTSFKINGTLASNPDVVSAGDIIDLVNNDGSYPATFIVPNELAVWK